MTTIINLRHHRCDIVCDRTSIYGNRFEIGRDGTRDDVCDKYEEYFQKRILTDASFRDRIHSLKDKKLGCWCRCLPECHNPKCKPLRCHLETIVNYLDNEI